MLFHGEQLVDTLGAEINQIEEGLKVRNSERLLSRASLNLESVLLIYLYEIVYGRIEFL